MSRQINIDIDRLDATVEMATSKILSQPDGDGSRDYMTVIELLDALHEGELPRDGQDWHYRHVLSMDGRRPYAWIDRHGDCVRGSVYVCAIGADVGDNIASLPAAWWFNSAARSWTDDGSTTESAMCCKGEVDARREFAALAARAEEMTKRGQPGGYGVSSVVTVRAQASPLVEAALREVMTMERDCRGVKESLLVWWAGDEVRKIEYCRDASESPAPRAGDELVLQTLDLMYMQCDIREDCIDSAIEEVLDQVCHYYMYLSVFGACGRVP